jgi:hypothetical protein
VRIKSNGINDAKNLAVALDDEANRRQRVAMRPGDLAGLDHLNSHEQSVRRAAHGQSRIVEQKTAARCEAFLENVAGFGQLLEHRLPRPDKRIASRPRPANALGQQAFIKPLPAEVQLF